MARKSDIGPVIGIDGEAEFRAQLRSMGEQLKTLGTEMKAVTSAFDANDKSQTALTAKSDVLTRQLDVQRARIEEIQKALDHARANYDENSTEVQRWQQALNNATTDLNNTQRELDNLGREMEETGDSTAGLSDRLKTSLSTAAKIGAAAIGAVSTALGFLVKNSVENFANYEQLVGGVETLFSESGSKVVEYANNAYKTAGLSANEYMKTVTSFSASLLQSLGGDTDKAASVADQAITDMSDNANKMGTSMESIQNAYQGFAKQNYTMLDNLKLGYGGTKEEMQRLLSDAEKLSGQKFDLSSYADIVEAIHVVQTEMGITGTTAKEASETISGSVSAAKAAWQNLTTGLASDNADLDTLINEFTESIVTAAGNIMPRIMQILSGIGDAIVELAPIVGQKIPEIVAQVLPSLISAATQLVSGLAGGFIQAAPQLLAAGGDLLMQLVDGISQAVPNMIAALSGIIDGFLDFITEHLPEVLEQGTSMVQSMADGILEAIPELLNAVPQIIESFVTFISENLPVILDSGIDLLLSLADGIITAVPDLVAQLPQIVQNIADTLSANFPKIIQTGVNMLIKLGDGILSALPNLLGIIPQVTGSAIDLFNTMVDSVKEIGSNVIRGLWNGISDMAGWIAEKIKGFGAGVLNSLKNFFGIHSPSTLFRDEVGQYIGLGVAAGIEDSTDKAVKSADTMAKNVYKRSKEWADRQTKYLGLSYDDQIALWQTIQGQFVKSSAQYADAEEVIFDLREKQAKELAKTQEEAAKQQEKALDEYQKKAETIYKNINDLETDYQDALTDRAQEIYNTYGLFDQIAERQKVSGDELTRNLKGQVNMMEEFYSGLDELFDRGVTAELVDEIRAMGPDAIDELNALLGMTDKQLSEYAALYQEKQQLANDVALEELEGLRQQTNQQIMDQLRGLEQLYDEYAPQVGTALTDGMAQGIESGMSNVINSAVRAAQAAVAAVKNALDIHSPSGVFADEVGKNMALGLGEGFTNEMRRVSANMQTAIPTPTVDTVNNAAAGMVNGLAAMGGGQNFPSTIVLKLENGAEVARWQLPYLRRAERSDPEVVSGV